MCSKRAASQFPTQSVATVTILSISSFAGLLPSATKTPTLWLGLRAPARTPHFLSKPQLDTANRFNRFGESPCAMRSQRLLAMQPSDQSRSRRGPKAWTQICCSSNEPAAVFFRAVFMRGGPCRSASTPDWPRVSRRAHWSNAKPQSLLNADISTNPSSERARSPYKRERLIALGRVPRTAYHVWRLQCRRGGPHASASPAPARSGSFVHP